MAILIVIRCVERDGSLRRICWEKADGTKEGEALLDVDTTEIELSWPQEPDGRYQTVCVATKRQLESSGDIPNEYWYAA